MSALAREHGAINLAQGFPDFPAPALLKEAAARAIADDVNQYAITWGSRRLREALARKYAEWYGMAVNPETEITVTCGSTEAMVATLMAIVEPGDEVIVFDPFYENYGPDAILCGATLRHVPLPIGAPLDLERLAAAFSSRTRVIILNSPANPTGRVLSRDELAAIAALVPALRCVGGDGRDLRAHPLCRPPRAHGDAARDGRAHRHHQWCVEDVCGDRLAYWLGHRARRRLRRDPEGARLPDRGRAGSAHGGRGRGARRAPGGILRQARVRVLRSPQPAARNARRVRLPRCTARRRLLHPRRLLCTESTCPIPSLPGGSPPRSVSPPCRGRAFSAHRTPRVASYASPSASARRPSVRPPSGWGNSNDQS